MEFIDKSQIMQGIEQDSTADVLEKGMNHKYYKREGTPGNYKYYYSEYEYKREKGLPVSLKGELGEIREFEGKFYRKQAEGKWLEVSSDGLTKKEHQDSLKRAQDTERKYLEQESQAPLMIKQEIAKQTSIITKLSDVEIDIEKEENKKYSIFGYREHLIDYGTKNGDKDLVEYAKTASDKQIEQRMKSDKYEEQFQDRAPEKKEDSHDSRFKFRNGTEVSFTHKGETIQGTISDYNYNSATFEKQYDIDYKKDGKSLTMIGVPENKIQDKTSSPSEVEVSSLNLKELREELFKNGFSRSKYLYANNLVEYRDSKNRSHSIYLNEDKPTQVKTWTIQEPGEIVVRGVIGNFVGGKASKNRFSFSSIDKLKSTLENF